ncbi:MAG: hypothetical protein LBI53_07255 [Candidatus Peribacteria bacterium]|jgi:amino acid permease|nr:hypothetical protein [Candidatus Peribacteria bacterium]
MEEIIKILKKDRVSALWTLVFFLPLIIFTGFIGIVFVTMSIFFVIRVGLYGVSDILDAQEVCFNFLAPLFPEQFDGFPLYPLLCVYLMSLIYCCFKIWYTKHRWIPSEKVKQKETHRQLSHLRFTKNNKEQQIQAIKEQIVETQEAIEAITLEIKQLESLLV